MVVETVQIRFMIQDIRGLQIRVGQWIRPWVLAECKPQAGKKDIRGKHDYNIWVGSAAEASDFSYLCTYTTGIPFWSRMLSSSSMMERRNSFVNFAAMSSSAARTSGVICVDGLLPATSS